MSNKIAQIHLRCSPEEKEELERLASEARFSLSQYVIAIAKQKKIYYVDNYLAELCRQIIKVGTNVNQIALVANTHKTVSEKQLETVNQNLIKIQQLLSDTIDTIQNSSDEIKV